VTVDNFLLMLLPERQTQVAVVAVVLELLVHLKAETAVPVL